MSLLFTSKDKGNQPFVPFFYEQIQLFSKYASAQQLTASDILIWMFIRNQRQTDNRGYELLEHNKFITTEKMIIENLGFSRTTVAKSIGRLKGYGLIKVIKHKYGNSWTTGYIPIERNIENKAPYEVDKEPKE